MRLTRRKRIALFFLGVAVVLTLHERCVNFDWKSWWWQVKYGEVKTDGRMEEST